ncbi:MAG: hypothetical protein IH957_05865 [Chloroflexi bacterium]|nr:hypothetical protein [Chloroflexota bacterium]
MERHGLIARLDSFEASNLEALTAAAPDFVIALLSSPGDAYPMQPGTVICEPYRALADISAVREIAPAYIAGDRNSSDLLTPEEIGLFERGRFIAAGAIEITPSDVFADRHTDFRRLACEVFRVRQQTELIEGLAQALCAPEPVTDAQRSHALRDLRRLVQRAQKSSALFGNPTDITASDALDRVRPLSSSRKPETLAVAARRQYSQPVDAIEDVFLLRAIVECPDIVPNVIEMREFVEACGGGANDSLAIDCKLVAEQLQFAALVPEPRLFPTATAAFEHFRRRYRHEYSEHHTRFWSQMEQIASRLRASRERAAGLHRLNTISELGPPFAMAALGRYGELTERPSQCGPGPDKPPDLGSGTVCPECHLQLDDTLPDAAANDSLKRIDDGIRRQMNRLASAGVRQALARGSDPRIDRFLRVVQAAQISSLVEVLDDELTGFLRRFLVEARVSLILEPLLLNVAHGDAQDPDGAREAFQRLAEVMEQAFHAADPAISDRPIDRLQSRNPPQ